MSSRILALEKLGAVFNQVSMALQYTPRKFVIHPETNNLVLIETDHNAYTEDTKLQRKQQMAEVSSLEYEGKLVEDVEVRKHQSVFQLKTFD